MLWFPLLPAGAPYYLQIGLTNKRRNKLMLHLSLGLSNPISLLVEWSGFEERNNFLRFLKF